MSDEHNCDWKDEAVAQREYADAVIASTKSRKRAAEEIAKAERRGEIRVARAFQEWALTNEIAEPPLNWKWFGEICRRFSDIYEDETDRPETKD